MLFVYRTYFFCSILVFCSTILSSCGGTNTFSANRSQLDAFEVLSYRPLSFPPTYHLKPPGDPPSLSNPLPLEDLLGEQVESTDSEGNSSSLTGGDLEDLLSFEAESSAEEDVELPAEEDVELPAEEDVESQIFATQESDQTGEQVQKTDVLTLGQQAFHINPFIKPPSRSTQDTSPQEEETEIETETETEIETEIEIEIETETETLTAAQDTQRQQPSLSKGEVAFLRVIGRGNEDIRAFLDEETDQLIEASQNWLSRLFITETSDYPHTTVDDTAEFLRIKENLEKGRTLTEGDTPYITRTQQNFF